MRHASLVAADVDGAEELRLLTTGGELVELRAVRWIEDASGVRLGTVSEARARACVRA